ncbi:MAG: IclR family transcriptional regulator, partial [Gammaproteobacteria bacterium HGW-Gammaproteobacteria-5]
MAALPGVGRSAIVRHRCPLARQTETMSDDIED